MNDARTEIHKSLSASISVEISELFLKELDELHHRFRIGDYRPTELSGGRFAEVCFRICQFACTGSHTPLDKKLQRTDLLVSNLENTPAAQCDSTFRIHMPRSLQLLYDLRNKRDVAHLGSGVSPNLSDSTAVISIANWIAAEIIRVFHQCPIEEAQEFVDSIIQKRTPLVYDNNEILRVLNPSLSYPDQVLVLLYHLHPSTSTVKELFQAVEHSHITRFKSNILQPLHDDAMIHFKNDVVTLMPPGFVSAESVLMDSGY